MLSLDYIIVLVFERMHSRDEGFHNRLKMFPSHVRSSCKTFSFHILTCKGIFMVIWVAYTLSSIIDHGIATDTVPTCSLSATNILARSLQDLEYRVEMKKFNEMMQ